MIVHGKDGILIDGSVGNAVQAIAYMVNHPSKRCEFAACASRVVKSYERSAVLGQLKEIYGDNECLWQGDGAPAFCEEDDQFSSTGIVYNSSFRF